MTIKEIKLRYFPELAKWMEDNKIDDFFPLDVWKFYAWQAMYNEFNDQVKREHMAQEVLGPMPAELLENVAKQKREQKEKDDLARKILGK